LAAPKSADVNATISHEPDGLRVRCNPLRGTQTCRFNLDAAAQDCPEKSLSDGTPTVVPFTQHQNRPG
jgi:hypothetical protein